VSDAVDPDDMTELRSRLAAVADRVRHPNLLLAHFLSREAVYNDDSLIDIDDDESQIPAAELEPARLRRAALLVAAEEIIDRCIDDLQVVEFDEDGRLVDLEEAEDTFVFDAFPSRHRGAYDEQFFRNVLVTAIKVAQDLADPGGGPAACTVEEIVRRAVGAVAEQWWEIADLGLAILHPDELLLEDADFEFLYEDAFYAQRRPPTGAGRDVLALSVDGKGIVMRPEALRPATAHAAAEGTPKLSTRLSKGEKRNRKRMAEVGVVYDAEPVVRTPADILARTTNTNSGTNTDSEAPVAVNKWLTASVTDAAATVVGQVFDEADRRDPTHARTWIALVDGNNHQIDRIQTEATQHGVDVTILCDFIHVLEYLWKAAWSFHNEGDPAAEEWVHDKAIAVLQGKATQLAARIRRAATRQGLDPPRRAGADACATYLTNKAPYLDYPTALHNGWPIATGVIEGACRHLIKDRMDITGARWGLTGAEAILKLRALRSNGDFPAYWHYHLTQERQRIHETRYHNGIIPQAA
jgi:hypothetical protein